MTEIATRRQQHLDFILRSTRACVDLGNTFMRRGRNRWIDVSIDEGWSFNCREMARSVAREAFRMTGQIMTLVDIDDAVKFSKEDYDYFKRHGRSLTQVDLYDVCRERSNVNGRAYPILQQHDRETVFIDTEDPGLLMRSPTLKRMGK